MKRILALAFTLILCASLNTLQAQVKILFDDTKNQTSGSADWVIDADVTKYAVPQLPTPSQTTVTSKTTDTFWTGALSSWGIDCVNKGYHVESLPSSGKITYGSKTNAQDLSNYKVYIIDEPNTKFNATEKTAILNFVKNGGGLFIISDHAGSDRNNDGSDSPTVWDDLFTNNGTVSNPFGIRFDTTNPNGKTYPSDITEVSTNLTKLTNPIIKGTYGTVTKLSFSRGTTMVLDTVANNTVKGVVFSKQSTGITSGAMVAYAKYGKGKIVAIGDSSPMDDGTGFTNTGLYKSYSGDSKVADNHRYLCMNATIWLATTDTVLPINFVNVTGTNSNNSTTIQWQVNGSVNEQSNYEVERSVDGNNFSTVTDVKAAKNVNNALSNYEFSTKESITSTVYYRIKAIDNGAITYSKVVSITPSQATSKINIFPNPISSNTNSSFTVAELTAGSLLTITNLQGVKYFEQKVTSPSITLNTNNVGGKKLLNGVYIVTVKSLLNNTSSVSRLVVGK